VWQVLLATHDQTTFRLPGSHVYSSLAALAFMLLCVIMSAHLSHCVDFATPQQCLQDAARKLPAGTVLLSRYSPWFAAFTDQVCLYTRTDMPSSLYV
jgi:hypothetical protein